MSRKLRLVAIANSKEVRLQLEAQLQSLDFVESNQVVMELAEAHSLVSQAPPDVILVDLTNRELDGGLFIQAMSMDEDQPYVLFALHEKLNHQIILESVRQGAKEFIHYPQDQTALNEALKRMHSFISRVSGPQSATNQVIAEAVQRTKDSSQCKIITVFGCKGGVGASTIAVNLAHELKALTKEPVLLFDMDQVFNNTAVMLNLKPNHSLGDLTRSAISDIEDSILKKIMVQHESGLDLLVASKSVLDDNDMISPDLLDRTLDFIKSNYTYAVVDIPTHVLDAYHQFFVEKSEEVFLVSSLDIPGLYRSRQYLDLATQFLDESKLKLILNRWNLKAAVGMTNKSLEEEFRYPVFMRLMNDWDLNVECNSLGKVFSKLNPNAELVKNVQQLAKYAAGIDSPEPMGEATENPSENENGKFGGLLGKLFGQKKVENEDQAHATS